eukprot:c26527_g1_i1.p1 GENE.c26527_g1_i1~~c26527_g1_i1.p1  ORF type:complete len:585 (+),score=128.53 c26527_g1_i1:97-1755(+)
MVTLAALAALALATVAGAQSLSISPSVLKNNLDSVTISWSGVAVPRATDFVAIYLPADNEDAEYIGLVSVARSASWQTGSGKVYLSLVNPRQAYQFRMWSLPNATALNATVVATSPLLTFANINEPLQGHLALMSDPTEMRIQWTTATAGTPTVEYGTVSHAYTESAKGNSSTYTIDDLCAPPANLTSNFLNPGMLHSAVMTGLTPGRKYYYRFGDPNNGGWSDEASFIASPGAGANIPIDILVFGDLGIDVPWTATIEMQPPALQTMHWLSKSVATLVLHIGDISYARGYAWVWEVYQTLIEAFALRMPVMTAIGNHEFDQLGFMAFDPSWVNYGNDSGGECGVPYAARYQMLGPTPETQSYYYSFDYGNVHFTIMSTETDFLNGSAQWDWLNADLAAVDRKVTPFLVFTGHRPIVTSSEGGQNTQFDWEFIDNIETLLIKYDVDLAIAGHVHAYERTFPMRNYTVDEDGLVYVVAGMAGNNYQTPWMENDGAVVSGNGHFLEPSWISFRTQSFGYCRLSTNSTHLRFRFYGDQANQIHDEFYLTPKVWRK